MSATRHDAAAPGNHESDDRADRSPALTEEADFPCLSRNPENAKSISESPGHSSVAFTPVVYAGCTEDTRDEAARRLQALIMSRDSGR